MKAALERIVTEAGVRVRLHARDVDSIVRDGQLVAVVTEANFRREAWTAAQFVYATGDGDVPARAGCEFEIGEPDTGRRTQPMSLMALLTGIRLADVSEFVAGCRRTRYSEHPKQRLRDLLAVAGASPSYQGATLWAIHDHLFALMANHEYGNSALDADDLPRATLNARGELNEMVAAIRRIGGVWQGVRLVATAEQIGVREARRVRGTYRITVDDLRSGARYPDAVCRVTARADVHALEASERGYLSTSTVALQDRPAAAANVAPVAPYDVPLRALIARDVEGLLLAGRCISGDFLAHSSYRVTGNAVAMGERRRRRSRTRPHATGQRAQDLEWDEIERRLAQLRRGLPAVAS